MHPSLPGWPGQGRVSGVREEASQDVLENNRDVVGGHCRRAVVRAAAKGIALFPPPDFMPKTLSSLVS